MKKIVIIIFILSLPKISLAQYEKLPYVILETSLKKDLENASEEIKNCFRDLYHYRDQNEEVLEKEVSQCLKNYITTSLTSICDEESWLAGDFGSDIEILKEQLEFEKNQQSLFMTKAIEQLRQDTILGKRFIEDTSSDGGFISLFFIVLPSMLAGSAIFGFAGAVVGAWRGASAVIKVGKLIVPNTGIAGKVVGGAKGAAIGNVVGNVGGAGIGGLIGFQIYKEPEFLYQIAETDDLCQIKEF